MSISPHIFDIIVVGGGPAGAMAALHASMHGRSVCLIDRHEKIGTPVRCGEGVGLKGFSRSLTLRPQWILSPLSKVSMHAPSGTTIVLENLDASFIIDRSKMEPDLIADAQRFGATIVTEKSVVSVNRDALGTYCCESDTKETYFSKCLIIADGVESRLAGFCGWDTHLNPLDIETCAFAKVTAPSIATGHVEMFFGKDLAPGGYVWIFPRGGNDANVGLGVLGSRCTAGKPMELLRSFIEKKIPNAHVSNIHCGSVPVGKYVSTLVRGGALLVGDAARQVDCLHGGGIAYSLYAGKLAGTVASAAFKNGVFNQKKLMVYQKTWAKDLGKQQLRTYALKKIVVDFSDKQLDEIGEVLSKKNPSALNYMRVHMQAFMKHPMHLVKAFLLSR